MRLLGRLHWARIYAALVTLLLPLAYYQGGRLSDSTERPLPAAECWRFGEDDDLQVDIPRDLALDLGGYPARVCVDRVSHDAATCVIGTEGGVGISFYRNGRTILLSNTHALVSLLGPAQFEFALDAGGARVDDDGYDDAVAPR